MREQNYDTTPRKESREFDLDEVNVPQRSALPRRVDNVVVWSAGDTRNGASRQPSQANQHAAARADILFLAANPRSTSKLALEKEATDVFQKLDRVTGVGRARRIKREVVHAARIDDLTHYLLRSRPTFVHFSGHGSAAGKLLLEDERGEAAPVSVAALGRLLGDIGGVRCVVLNACYLAEQASAIAQHVPCVVGMSAAFADAAAIAFAGTFYEALAFGEGIERAFQLACSAIDLHSLPDADVPRLLFREGINPSEVRFFEEEAEASAAPHENPAPHPLVAISVAVGLILVLIALVVAMSSTLEPKPSSVSPMTSATH